jgi:hypothetical protein
MQIPVVTASAAAETEYASLFINGQHAFWIRFILTDLGYRQLASLITVNYDPSRK